MTRTNLDNVNHFRNTTQLYLFVMNYEMQNHGGICNWSAELLSPVCVRWDWFLHHTRGCHPEDCSRGLGQPEGGMSHANYIVRKDRPNTMFCVLGLNFKHK